MYKFCRKTSLWPTYIGKRRTTFAKEYGIKVRCYWGRFALIPPFMGDQLSSVQVESEYPNQTQLERITPFPLPPSPPNKTKKGGPFTPSMTPLLIGCIQILVLKLATTIYFWPGLIRPFLSTP
jgi:hypothetical protein